MEFTRTRFTLLSYGLLSFYSYSQSSIGPIIPFLQDDLSLNRTQAGMHLSAFALGMVLMGITGDAFVGRFGRRRALWGGGMAMALGTILFGLGQIFAVTLLSRFLMGFLGSLLLIQVQSTLADLHGNNRAVALTEANIAASIAATVPPLLIGFFEVINWGWRGALVVAVLYWVLLMIRGWEVSVPPAHVDAQSSVKRLPREYWVYWVILFFGVSAEWCVVTWAADFLDTEKGLDTALAASLTTVYFAANIVGRYVFSMLTRRYSVNPLMLAAIALAFVGFLLFWLAPWVVVNVIGLFVAGFGVSNLFPLGISAATGVVAPHQTDAASGRISLAGGLAIFSLPLVLGALADTFGIFSAYGIVPILLLLVGVLTFLNMNDNVRSHERDN